MMNATEQQYRKHWATLTGKSEREIYVPLALREAGQLKAGDRIRILVDWASGADVRTGDILAVKAIEGRYGFTALGLRPGTWMFGPADEGVEWERIR